MSNRFGVLAALVSSALGGFSGAITRYLTPWSDPVTLAAFRFGIAVVLLLPIAFVLGSRRPQGKDLYASCALGTLYFAIFFFLYNFSLSMTTAARGSLALATLPLTTMLVGAALGKEPLSMRKSAGVLIAVLGVASALASGLADAPAGAWRGDLVMVGATLLMALYTVWSRAFVARSSRLGFLTTGMGAGALVSVSFAALSGGFAVLPTWQLPQWAAAVSLGVLGGAAAFYLWVLALEHTTPTRVANTMTINPVAAATLALVLVGEPIGMNLLVGIAAVAIGIWLASTESSSTAQSSAA
jgi:drug/metabolite transporter (DMT)-like permease